MIRVEKDAMVVPSKLQTHFKNGQERVICSKITSLLEARSTKVGQKSILAKDIYQGAKAELMKLYHGKCAYCETSMRARGLQIEHYRPINGGYYWLAYEWTNLTLACASCNGAKGSEFPITGKKISQPGKPKAYRWFTDRGPYLNERPIYLNPEHDDPSPFLRFKYDGYLESCCPTGRGAGTINACDLNCKELISWRLKAINQFRDRFQDALQSLLTSPVTKQHYLKWSDESFARIFEDLCNMKTADTEYAGIYRSSILHFMDFYGRGRNLKELEAQPKQLLRQAHSRYLKSKASVPS